MLASDSSRAFYGYDYVLKASEVGAIESLMISDALLRSCSIEERKKKMLKEREI